MKGKDIVKSEKHIAPEILEKRKNELLDLWMKNVAENKRIPTENVNMEKFRDDAENILQKLLQAISFGNTDTIDHPEYEPLIETIKEIAISYIQAGFTHSQTASCIFELKHAIVATLNEELSEYDRDVLVKESVAMSELIFELNFCIVDEYVKRNEDTISAQIQAMSEMSTPVIMVWKNIIMLPLVGIIDSVRAQNVMEACLKKITETESKVCILDISGVASVDTAVANHIIKITKAVKLVGADCILSGMSSDIAQTIVHLGIDFSGLITATTLRDALLLSFEKLGLAIKEDKDISRKGK